MKVSKILGVIVFTLVMILLVRYDKEVNPTDLSASFSSEDGIIADSTLNYYESKLTNDNTSDENSLTYTNKNAYPVTLTADNIKINCIGSGDTKIDDERIVSDGFKLKVSFSNNNNLKEDSIIVNKGETVNIYITSEYVSNEYPQNEVKCSYSLNILTA